MHRHPRARRALLLSAAILGISYAATTRAAPTSADDYRLPAQDLASTLRAIGHRANTGVMFAAGAVAGLSAGPVFGHLTAAQAVARAIAGSGLVAIDQGGTILVGGRSQDAAAAAAVADDDAGGQEIIVTGTQIRGAGPVGSKLLTIDRSAIERSGFTTTQQILQSLPQNFGGGPNEGTAGAVGTGGANLDTAFGSSVNLRGLGPSSTLVLLDGNRLALGGIGGVFGDLSMIPASAIERVEVLTDGASSLYGSDAVAGVVNIIPRKTFKGFETSVMRGSADGTANEFQASQLAGTSWSGGHAMLAFQYDQRGRLAASDRSFYTEDLRRYVGPDRRSDFGNPGTIVGADGQTYAIPGGQTGTHLSSGDLIAGTANRSDDLAGTDILPKQRSESVYATAEQRFGDVSVYGSGLYTHRVFDKRVFQGFAQSLPVDPGAAYYVDPDGSGRTVSVNYRLSRDFGQEHDHGMAEAASVVGGASIDVGPWRFDAHANWGRQLEIFRDENAVDYSLLFAALDDPDPATAFDPFGDGSNTNPATIERLRGFEYSRGVSTMWAIAGKADGPLFNVPAGAVKVAVGGEYRRERFASRGSDNLFSDVPVSDPTVVEDRRIAAGFAEVDAPLFSPDQNVTGVRRLDITGSVRVENYDDFGTTTNPKAGISWETVRGLTLRGTVGTSFRAPNFTDLEQQAVFQSYFTIPLSDPKSPTGTTNALILVGNKPGIGPERARTITAGIDLAPPFAPGLTASLNWFSVRYRDRIQSPSSIGIAVLRNRAIYQPLIDDDPSAAELAGYFASPSFSNEAGFAPGDVRAIVDLRNQNLAVSRESGLDFQLDYRFRLGAAQVDAGIDGTWLFWLKQSITKTAPATDILGTIGNPVDLRLRSHLSWDEGPFGASLFVNFTDGYRNTLTQPTEHVASWTTFDGQLSWNVTGAKASAPGMRLALNAINLFDRPPPYVDNEQGIITFGYDPENASALGRVVSAQLTVRW